MNQVVFFDIDGVIFNAQKFLNNFCENLLQKLNLDGSEKEKLIDLYREVKKEKGFFDPQSFLKKLSQYSIEMPELEKLWWNEQSFRDNLLLDEDFLKKIQEKASIGIFSKGEIDFQRKKIEAFKGIINPEDIYIFENKIEKISDVLKNYAGYKIYMVDDNENVLESFKNTDKNIHTIFVAKDKLIKSDFIDTQINDIHDLINVIDFAT